MTARVARRSALAIMALLVGAILASCDDEGPSGFEPDSECIGPAGGTIAVTDTSDILYGLAVTAEPGAWQECWSVYFYYHWTFDTPNFPDGLEGYEGFMTGSVEYNIGRQVSLEEWIDAPQDLEMDLTFPVGGVTAEPGERLVAFRYDDEAGIYRLAFPERVEDGLMTVTTNQRDPFWTWGKVDLEEVDFDTYLAPVMEQMHGEGLWLQIQAELDSLQQAALQNQHELNCAAVRIVRNSLAAGRDAAAQNVRDIQTALAGDCGECDATSREFYEELSEYLKLKVEAILTDLFLGDSRNLFIRLYGFIMVQYAEYCIDQLACDFECFAESVNAAFYYQLAIFYASALTVELADWYLAVEGCGPASMPSVPDMQATQQIMLR
jgi:hypothetical protein